MSSQTKFVSREIKPQGVFWAVCPEADCGWASESFHETYFDAQCETSLHLSDGHFSEEQRLTARLEIKFPGN